MVGSVDVVLHIRGVEVVWISPSVQAALREPPQLWIGSDFLSHIHPDDVDAIAATTQAIAAEGVVVTPRFRVRAGDGGYHWVDGHGKGHVDAEGNVDGATGSLRVVNDKVEAEGKRDTVGRTGGDEILVLLPGLHCLGDAAEIAEKIRTRAAEPIQQSGQTIRATLSIGAAIANPGESILALTARVDAAMYRAQEKGRNRVTCI